MGTVSVADVLVTPLKRIPVTGGDVLHGLKCSDRGYVNFGEAYFSQVHYGAVKAWKRHLRMTLNLIVPIGKVRVVLVDDQGEIREEVIGEERYVRLTVPPGYWFGFQGMADSNSLLLNIADIQHDPDEVERKEITDIDFDWEITE